jgi:hypothetical protein
MPRTKHDEYLDNDVVMDTLKKMADLSVKGSVIAKDFYPRAFNIR